MARGLTGRMRRFVDELLLDGNVTQAARRAGYAHNSAAQVGARLARLPKVATAIEVGRAELTERARLRATDVLLELKRIAFADPRRAFDATGNPIPVHQLPEDVARALASVEVETVLEPARVLDDGQELAARARASVKKWKWWNKSHALELAMRHLGMFPSQRLELGGGANGEEPLEVTINILGGTPPEKR